MSETNWVVLTPEQEAEINALPCIMTHTLPFDFAQCERHDTTFALGDVCKYHTTHTPDCGCEVSS